LEAVTRQAQNVPGERVEAAFEASLKADGGFFPAREAYVSYLLGQEKFAKATTVIHELMKGNEGSAKAWQLEVESEAAQQRYTQALQLAQEARAKFPDDVDLRMEMAGVYRLRGMDKEADAELQGIIRDMPKYEAAYRALVNALFMRTQRGSSDLRADVAALMGTLNKMTAELPESRFGRIANAVVDKLGGRIPEAEALLRTAVAADPDDPEALVPLAQVVGLLGRPTEGVALLESSLKRKAQVDVVRGLAALYRGLDRKAEALALVKRYAEENPDGEGYALVYEGELAAEDKPGEAVAVLQAARARFPRSQAVAETLARLQQGGDDNEGAVATMREFMKANGETSERLYLLANFCSMAGNEDGSVAALQRVLAIMPDHIGANNDLGYFWVNAGIHMEQAEPMIRKALENKPNDPSFLDSLGWLNYKQGKFAEAAALLQKALALPDGTAPEVVQHFGDTLYRMGRGPEAIEQWAKALQMLAISAKLSAAEAKVREYLTKAVTEARAGRVPAVSPIVEAGPSKAAGSAGPAGTMPQ
jgi:predicted Zn-dependent protease